MVTIIKGLMLYQHLECNQTYQPWKNLSDLNTPLYSFLRNKIQKSYAKYFIQNIT